MSVEVATSTVLKSTPPKPLFQTRIRMADFLMGYAVAADGQRFLLNNAPEEVESGPITVIANWNPGATR